MISEPCAAPAPDVITCGTSTCDGSSASFPEALLSLVERIAKTYAKRAPKQCDLDDFVQDGTVGLLQALKHYRAGTGASLETFASYRIRGAILDRARQNDPLSRKQRREWREDLSIHEQLDHLEADRILAPGTVCAIEAAWLRRRVAGLPARERYIVGAYYSGYFDSEIAVRLGVSEDVVYNTRKRALKRLGGV